MTKKETISLFGILIAAYPNFDKFKDDSQVEGMVNMWASLFADDDSAIVGLAAKKHIMTSKWPPSIAEIREIMADITHPDLIPPDQAWAAVSDLLYTVGEHNYGDAHRNLPPLIAQTVDAIGWHTLYQLHRGSYGGNKDGMDRVAFMDLYRPAYERHRHMIEILIGFVSGGALAALIKVLADRFAWKQKRQADKEDKVERKQEEAERQAALKVEERLEAIEEMTGALKEAMKFVLYDRIRYLGQAYIADKEIDFDDRRILNNMHHTYHYGLCGNGDLDTLMEEVNRLPLKTR